MRGAAQGLVVLQRQRAFRGLAAQRRLVGGQRLVGLAAARLLAGLLQHLGIAAQVDGLLQAADQRAAGMAAPELGQVGAGLLRAAAIEFDLGQAVQRVGMVGREPQQLLPRFGGAFAVAARLPVLALLDQDLHGVALGQRAAVQGRGQQAQDYRVVAC